MTFKELKLRWALASRWLPVDADEDVILPGDVRWLQNSDHLSAVKITIGKERHEWPAWVITRRHGDLHGYDLFKTEQAAIDRPVLNPHLLPEDHPKHIPCGPKLTAYRRKHKL